MILQSRLFSKTRKDIDRDETSANAKLLLRAGFIDKTMAGVYSLLPLGLRVVERIKSIIRDEMNATGAQELLLPALQPSAPWKTTGRWDTLDVLFKVPGAGDAQYALGPTHEEIVVPLAKKIISSYRELPLSVYQIQMKFRNEPRAKSGILRGREFLMKDLYSFHASQDDMETFYESMREVYMRVFMRCGVKAVEARAGGGTFSKFSHEYQVPTEAGEDTIYMCSCGFAENEEIAEASHKNACPSCSSKNIIAARAIEVGNIFKLNTKFSAPFGLTYKDKDGKDHEVYMGCFGIGITRLFGAIVEIHHDTAGIVWPPSVAPCDVHVVPVGEKTAEIDDAVQKIAKLCASHNREVLVDDRHTSAGVAFSDSDLIGIPLRVVVSAKSLHDGGVEVKRRTEESVHVVDIKKFGDML